MGCWINPPEFVMPETFFEKKILHFSPFYGIIKLEKYFQEELCYA